MSSTTLVGIFDDEQSAQKARQRLQQSGVPDQSIRISSSGSQSGAASSTAASSGLPREEEGAISRFFSDLFGLNDAPDARHYSEAVRRGHVVLTVQVADESRADAISEVLEDCGAVDVDEQAQAWQAAGHEPMAQARTSLGDDRAGMAATSGGRASSDLRDDTGEKLKVVEEELKVGKRKVEQGGVRVRRYVTEQAVEEQVSLHSEKAHVDRQKIDRPATEADLKAAFEEKSIEIRETTEEPVVSKAARVVEEVHVGKTASDRTETVRDTVRSSKVEVEQLGSGAQAANMRQRYAGPERRTNRAGSYAGAERRMAA